MNTSDTCFDVPAGLQGKATVDIAIPNGDTVFLRGVRSDSDTVHDIQTAVEMNGGDLTAALRSMNQHFRLTVADLLRFR